jgi:hypothetical protein
MRTYQADQETTSLSVWTHTDLLFFVCLQCLPYLQVRQVNDPSKCWISLKMKSYTREYCANSLYSEASPFFCLALMFNL